MTLERINELKNRPIDLSDIPEVTEEQKKDFYPRSLRKNFDLIYNIFDKENLQWLEQNGISNRVLINRLLEQLRTGALKPA